MIDSITTWVNVFWIIAIGIGLHALKRRTDRLKKQVAELARLASLATLQSKRRNHNV